MSKSLYQLLSWFSPAFPIGAYAYSHGLENAIKEANIQNKEDLFNWIMGVVIFGDIFQDGIIIKEAHRAFNDLEPLKDIAIFAKASRVSYEKALEDEAQANNFVKNILHTERLLPLLHFVAKSKQWKISLSYPVACGIATAAKGISANDVVLAYAHAFVSNMISVALKAIPLGQSDGLWVLMRSEESVKDSAKRCLNIPLNESSSSNFLLDIYSARHEKQDRRLFQS